MGLATHSSPRLIKNCEDLQAEFILNFNDTNVRPADASDLSNLKEGTNKSVRSYWTRFLEKKNKIVDCDDAEAIGIFKNDTSDQFL